MRLYRAFLRELPVAFKRFGQREIYKRVNMCFEQRKCSSKCRLAQELQLEFRRPESMGLKYGLVTLEHLRQGRLVDLRVDPYLDGNSPGEQL